MWSVDSRPSCLDELACRKDHKIYQGHLKRLEDDDLRRLKERIGELVNEEKYKKMVELAELPTDVRNGTAGSV
jgi:hypothetical protein